MAALTLKRLKAPLPSKIASPSPAALMAMGFSGVPLGRQVVGAIERNRADGEIVRVLVAVVLVDARMNQDGVAGFTRGRAAVAQSVPEQVRL